jgi:WD40 repeat protein
VLLGQELKYIVAGDESGVITLWKDGYQLEANCGSILRGHASKVISMAVTKHQDYLFTLGYSDNTILEWKIDLVTGPLAESKFNTKKNESINTPQFPYDSMVLRELYFCSSFKETNKKLSDSLSLFRGTTHKMLNAIMSKDLEEFDETELLNQRFPEISLSLSHVYGFESYDRRNTLMYVEDYEEDWETTYKGEMQYHPVFENSNRFYCYFVSRIVVMSDSERMGQKFYEGHKSKISCMKVHPSRKIVATGETAENPTIHLWEPRDCSPLKIIATDHGAGIINLAFSADGSFLISIGMDKYFSIQVTDWEMEQKIAFKNSSQSPLIDVVVNPNDKYEFATCGFHKVQIWQIVGKTLLVKENIEVNEGDKNQLPYVTAITYSFYKFGGHVESDLIVGTNFGDLGLVSKGNYITVKKTAHKKMINCLKVIDIINDVSPS